MQRSRPTERATVVYATTIGGGAPAPGAARAVVDALPIVLGPIARADLRLVVSELVTNSVVHSVSTESARIGLRFTLAGGTLRCEVSDSGLGFKLPRIQGPTTSTHGHGLYIVDRIATRWGLLRRGRTVWFEVDVGADA